MADSTAEVFSAARFTERADQSGLAGRELADRLGVTPTTLSALRNGRRAPSMDLLCKVVQVLGGAPADYLDLPDRALWSLRHFRFAAGLTQSDVSEDLGVAPAAVSGWETRRYNPPRTVLPRLSELYGSTVAELEAAVDRQGVVTPVDGLLITAQSVIGLAEAALEVAGTLSTARRRALALSVRERLEQSLEAMAGAVRDLSEDQQRAAVVDAVRRLAELHAKANSACK